jgi:hypothetical protein
MICIEERWVAQEHTETLTRRRKHMRALFSGFGGRAITFILVAAFSVQPALPAQTHVVSPADLRRELAAATAAREQNTETISSFLSSPEARKALQTVNLDATRISAAVSTLTDQEVADFASRAQQAQTDFAAGALTERDLLLIVLGLAALILIIVAVR